MNLSFDNLGELNAFINWATHFGREDYTPITYPRLDGVSGSAGDVAFDTPQGGVGGHSVFTAGDGSPADQEAKDLKVGPYDPSPIPPLGNASPPPEPAKRKRRTKAEIEADTAALANAVNAHAEPGCDGHALAGAEPATSTEQPTGTNPFEQAAAASGEAASEAGDAVATEESGETVVTPFQHLTRAREFIAKHGMPKYNESFTKAGLDANVMGYSAFQRALHMTALDELEKG